VKLTKLVSLPKIQKFGRKSFPCRIFFFNALFERKLAKFMVIFAKF